MRGQARGASPAARLPSSYRNAFTGHRIATAVVPPPFLLRFERRPAYRAAVGGRCAPPCRRRYALSRFASQ